MRIILQTLIVVALFAFSHSSAYAGAVRESDIEKVKALLTKANTLGSDINQIGAAIAEGGTNAYIEGEKTLVCTQSLSHITSAYSHILLALSVSLENAKVMRDHFDEKIILTEVRMWFSTIEEYIPGNRNTVNEISGNCQDSSLFNLKAQKLLDLMSEIDTILPPIANRLGLQKY